MASQVNTLRNLVFTKLKKNYFQTVSLYLCNNVATRASDKPPLCEKGRFVYLLLI